jgi:hypothetical protein
MYQSIMSMHVYIMLNSSKFRSCKLQAYDRERGQSSPLGTKDNPLVHNFTPMVELTMKNPASRLNEFKGYLHTRKINFVSCDRICILHTTHLEKLQCVLFDWILCRAIQKSARDTKILSCDTKILSHDTKILSRGTKILSLDIKILAHNTKIYSHDTKILLYYTKILSHDTKILLHDTKSCFVQTDP